MLPRPWTTSVGRSIVGTNLSQSSSTQRRRRRDKDSHLPHARYLDGAVDRGASYGRHMPYRTLGHTGMQVSSLCLGAMMFGQFGNRDHDDCVAIIHRALDAGINFIDTADVYSAGESEEIVAKALAGGRRDDVILATKCRFPVATGPFDANPPPNVSGSSRRHIIRACEDSLRRLGTDWIDLYQVHRPDYTTDIDETLGALSDLVHQGKVRAIGSSTFPAELDRRGAVDGGAPGPRAVPLRAAAVLDLRPLDRA